MSELINQQSPKKNIIDFTMGADPEFCCTTKTGELVRANEVGCSTGGKFGADGNGISFEVRPDPSNNPIDIVRDIRNIFKSKIKEKPDFLKYNWLAGGHQKGYPLGGHIHFGLKKDKNFDPGFTSAILSQYLGSVSLLLEDPSQAKLRRQGSYGSFEDHRAQSHGFEYRTLSSWLTNPHIATGILCLAKTIMDEVVNNESFKPGFYVSNTIFQQADTVHVLKYYPKIWEDITKMRLYQQKYKKEIDLLDYLIRNKLTWFTKGDMKSAWGLIDTRVRNSEINLDSIWGQYHLELREKEKSVRKRKLTINSSFDSVLEEPIEDNTF